MHGELDICEIDLLVFDEAHIIYPENPYVEIMNKFYFNSKQILNHHGLEKLPLVFSFFNLDCVLQLAQTYHSYQKVKDKLQFMANTFNASLLGLDNSALEKLRNYILRDLS